MTSTRRGSAVLVGMLFLLSVGTVLAQDWPQWRGLDRDGKVTEFTPPEVWPAALTQAWRIVVGTGDATPALVGDKVYVFARQGDNEVISCLNVADGAELWKDQYAATPVTGAAGSHPGPRGTPAVAEGKVVTLGVNGIVSCLDAATGAVAWREDPFPGVYPQFFTSMSPIIVDNMAVLFVGGKGNGALIAYDLATGEEQWRWAGEAPQYSSPVLMTVEGTKMLVTLTETSLVGVAVAEGALLWQVPFVPQRRAYSATTPIVDGQTVIFTGSGRGTKALKIEKQGEAFTATELWTNAEVACQFSTPVLRDGLLFGLSNGSKLFCLKADTGETAWVDETQRGRGGFGAMVAAGPLVFVLASDSMLVGFNPSDQGFTEVVKYKASETATYANPVVAGNSIYVKDQDAVTLWRIG